MRGSRRSDDGGENNDGTTQACLRAPSSDSTPQIQQNLDSLRHKHNSTVVQVIQIICCGHQMVILEGNCNNKTIFPMNVTWWCCWIPTPSPSRVRRSRKMLGPWTRAAFHKVLLLVSSCHLLSPTMWDQLVHYVGPTCPPNYNLGPHAPI